MPATGATLTRDETPSDDGAGQRPPTPDPDRGDGALSRRPDIDGLRAVAILLVVGYHANVPGLSAGFIGVDVFFVLSGFLITRLIINEVDRTGSLRLGRFWLRRGRRLLPASAVMVTSVLIVGQWLDSPLLWKSGITESLAALTYWSNELFAGRATDYFVQTNVSPLLHTWSLAVEEQFYVLWPLVFFLTARFAGTRSPRRSGAIRAAVVAGISIGSYALSMHLADEQSPRAFFAAISRAWEFGAGALLAVAAVRVASLRATVRGAVGMAGVLLLMIAMATIGEDTPFPTAALLPVAATIALIAAQSASGRGLGRLLGSHPFQVIGGLSYSWYLWHWPFVVFGTRSLGHDSVMIRVALSALALVPAELTRRLVENPVRRSPTLARSNVRSVALLAAVTLTGTAVAGSLWWRADRTLDDTFLAALVHARSDHATGTFDGPCASTDPEVMITGCVGGDPAGSGIVLVLGDSHASHWIPAVDAAASELGLRMTASTLGNCPSLDVRSESQESRCGQRQADLPDVIEAIDPDVVVVSHSVTYVGELLDAGGKRFPQDRQHDAWQDALTEFARDLGDRGIGLVVVLDVPRFDKDPLSCMARARSPLDCHASEAEMHTVLGVHRIEQSALAAAGHGIAYDPFPRLCPERCPGMIDGTIAYTDKHHLTDTFARSLGPDLAAAVRAAGHE